MRFIAAVLIGVCAIHSSIWAADEPNAALRADLEKAVAAVKAACEAGNEAQLKEAVSSRIYAQMKNGLASSARDIDAAVFAMILKAEPDLSKYVLAKAMEKGPTAGLIYKRDDSNANDATPKVEFILRRFVKENGSWRMDTNARTTVDKVKADGTATGLDDLKWSADAAIDGVVREAEPLLAKADFVGGINASRKNCAVEITINGVRQKIPNNNSDSGSAFGSIWGGLKKGENTIKIVVTPLNDKAKKVEAKVKIDAAMPDPANPNKRTSVEVFSWKPELSGGMTHEAKFTVPESTTQPAK